MNVVKPDLGPDLYLCYGTIGQIESNYSLSNVNFQWNTGDTTANINIYSSGTYVLTVTSLETGTSTACFNSDTVEIHYYPKPIVDFEAEGELTGCTPLEVKFNNLTTIDTSRISYVWTVLDEFGHLVSQSLDESPTITFQDQGVFSIMLLATSENGCADSVYKWHYIHTYLQPEVDFSFTPSVVYLNGDDGEVTFTTYLSNNIQDSSSLNVLWEFGDGEQDSENMNPVHQYSTWGDFVAHLTVSTEGDCKAEISHTVIVEADLIFPNVITPNGDGSNDVFAIGNLNTDINMEDPDEYRTNELIIYDRWGKQAYHAQNYDTYAKDNEIYLGSQVFTGENCSDGVYYYVFYYKGHYKETKYNGFLTVIR